MQRPERTRWAAALALAIGAGCSGGDSSPSSPGVSDIQDGAYLPDDGLVVVDLESGSAGGGWTEETALAGFTGTSYLRWTGANLFGTPGTDPFGFDIWIEDPGRYNFRIHNRHDDPDSTMANDLWVRMDGGEWVKAFSWQRGQWTWATQHEFSATNKPQAEYTLDRGNHRIEFSGRSFDFMVDRFHLYDDGVLDPLNTSHPESATFSGGGPMTAGALTDGDPDVAGVDAPRLARLEVAPFFADPLGAPAAPPLTAAGALKRFDESWNRSGPALARASDRGQGVDVVIAQADSVALGGWNLAASGAIHPTTRTGLEAACSATAHLDDVRWIFEAGPSLDPGTLGVLARALGSVDSRGRTRILRANADEVLRAWPDLLHGPFDGLVVLASKQPSEAMAACLRAIEDSGRSFSLEIRGATEGLDSPR